MNSDILSGSCYFYPRSPCGERPGTACMGNQEPYAYFYPRSPCGERRVTRALHPASIYFYPRSPCGERLCHVAQNFGYFLQFLSTLSLRRAT